MKKTTLLFVILTLLIITGCSKEHDHIVPIAQEVEMTIYFPAAGKRVAASNIYNISKYYNRSDQFALIYIRAEGSYWSLMPFTTENGSRYYNYVDCGYVKFFADAGEGMQWTNNFNADVKIIIINETQRTSLYAKGVDFSSHDEVVAAIGDDRKVSQAF